MKNSGNTLNFESIMPLKCSMINKIWQLRKDVVQALHSASDGMTTMDNLKQMTSAMKAITDKPEELSKTSQVQYNDIVITLYYVQTY